MFGRSFTDNIHMRKRTVGTYSYLAKVLKCNGPSCEGAFLEGAERRLLRGEIPEDIRAVRTRPNTRDPEPAPMLLYFPSRAA